MKSKLLNFSVYVVLVLRKYQLVIYIYIVMLSGELLTINVFCPKKLCNTMPITHQKISIIIS
jgi:hypothetical protein